MKGVKPRAPRLQLDRHRELDHVALDAWDAILPRAHGAGPLAPVAPHPSQSSEWQPLRTPACNARGGRHRDPGGGVADAKAGGHDFGGRRGAFNNFHVTLVMLGSDAAF